VTNKLDCNHLTILSRYWFYLLIKQQYLNKLKSLKKAFQDVDSKRFRGFSHYLIINREHSYSSAWREKKRSPHHHPKFDIDEDALPIAIRLFIEIIKAYDKK
jgi:hypothetical protein